MLDAGTPLAVRWLVLRDFTAEGAGSVPGLELRSHKPCDTAKKKKQQLLLNGQQIGWRRLDKVNEAYIQGLSKVKTLEHFLSFSN